MLALPPVLTEQEVEVDGRLVPWYLAPFEYRGELHDFFAEARVVYHNWASWDAEAKAEEGKSEKAADAHGNAAGAFKWLCEKVPAFFIHKLLHIVTKGRSLDRFDHWKVGQRRIWHAFAWQHYRGKPVRLVVLKARQVGGSTLVEAILFWKCLTQSHQGVLVMADKKSHASNMMAMVETYYRTLSETLPESRIPVLGTATKSELRFGLGRSETKPAGRVRKKQAQQDRKDKNPLRPVLNSTYSIQTAASNLDVRSFTASALHGSEVAFWPDPERNWLALAQCVPDSPGSIIVLESSANGAGDFFERFWSDCHQEDSSYEPVFVGWQSAPWKWEAGELRREYSRELPARYAGEEGGAAFVAGLSDEEQVLSDALQLDHEQVFWRRCKIVESCNGDPILFRQEYPSTPEEAFIVSGIGVYTPEACAHYIDATKRTEDNPILWRGELEINEDGTVRRIARYDGAVLIYAEPRQGRHYAIGVDPSEGRTKSADAASIQVFDADGLEQVAVFHAIRDIEYIAKQARALQILYSGAFLTPEANAAGAKLVADLRDLDAWPMYQREVPDKTSDEPRSVYGYYAAGGSKKRMIALLKELFNNRKIRLRHYPTALQFQSLVFEDGKFHSGKSGVGDDAHDAVGVCMIGVFSQQFRYASRPAGEGMVRAGDALEETTEARARGDYRNVRPAFNYGGEQRARFIHPVLGENF